MADVSTLVGNCDYEGIAINRKRRVSKSIWFRVNPESRDGLIICGPSRLLCYRFLHYAELCGL